MVYFCGVFFSLSDIWLFSIETCSRTPVHKFAMLDVFMESAGSYGGHISMAVYRFKL